MFCTTTIQKTVNLDNYFTNPIVTCYYFDSIDFTLNGKPAKIIGSEITGTKPLEVNHTVKCNGKIKVFTMTQLVKLYKKGVLK